MSKPTITEQLRALEDKLEASIPHEAWHTYMEIEALEGAQHADRIVLIHSRLKSVLPRYLWPLLALAVTDEDEPWKRFEEEQEDSLAEYTR